jgi:DNA polymerase-3 subunit epsilon
MRQIVLDTETTGLETALGHRIIEVGCVELVNRRLTGRHFHHYINPQRDIDAGAQAVHGISLEMLKDKPVFSALAQAFLDFVDGAELVIHNAAFDIGFIDAELNLWRPGFGSITKRCSVIDTLLLARAKHPGQKNNLDALCKRYGIDNSHRQLHGALLDAEILADVYLLMTGGQTDLSLGSGQAKEGKGQGEQSAQLRRLTSDRPPLTIIRANQLELERHQQKLESIDKSSGGNCIWTKPGNAG